jgi:hypothetical protein
MPVYREGTVIIGEGSTSIADPSTPPDVREDVVPFNVPFDRDKFTQLIKVHGYDVIWEKNMYCPFLKGPNPKSHDINCRVCSQGFVYFSPVETRMKISGLNLAQQYYAYGRFDSGRAQITAYPEYKVSFWDRITLVNSRVRFSELVKRQRSTLRDRPRFNPLTIERLAWPATESTLAYAEQDVGFTVDSVTGELVWEEDQPRPGADTFYSMVYYFRPAYLVLDLPNQVRDANVSANLIENRQIEFPVQAVGQLVQFIRDESKDPRDESDDSNPFPATESAFAIKGS